MTGVEPRTISIRNLTNRTNRRCTNWNFVEILGMVAQIKQVTFDFVTSLTQRQFVCCSFSININWLILKLSKKNYWSGFCFCPYV